jgi:hypothetical protein
MNKITRTVIRGFAAMAISAGGVTIAPLIGISQALSDQTLAQGCTAANRGTSPNCPFALRFQPGAYGTLINDQLTATPQIRYYALDARAGQRLTLIFAGAGGLRAGITFPGGNGDGPFTGEGNTIELPQTGKYVLYIGQNTMSSQPWRGSFSLAVMVR